MSQKFTYRWDPFDLTDFISRQAWLEKCAQKGLKLTSYTGKIFAKFEKVTPFKARYRIEYQHSGSMDDEQVALYEASGWEFVDIVGTQFFIFMSRDPHAEELHTDPEMQAYALRKLRNSHILNIIVSLLMIAFYAFIVVRGITKEDQPLLELVKAGPWAIMYIVLVFAALFSIQVSQAVRFIRTWRLIKDGREPKPKSYARSLWTDGLGWVLALVACFSWLITDGLETRTDVVSLTQYAEPLPFLQLHEIEQNDNFEYDSFVLKGKDWRNYLETSSTLFAPEIIEAKQYGASTLIGNGRLDNYLFTCSYTLCHEKLAAAVLTELTNTLKEDFTYEWLNLSFEGIDEAYFCTDAVLLNKQLINPSGDIYTSAYDDPYQFLFLRAGETVLKVCYRGTKNLQEFAGVYAALLK